MISRKIGHKIWIVVHQYVRKTISKILVVLVQLEFKLIQIHVRTYCTIQLCCCVSFLVIAGNFSVTLFYSTLFCCGGKANLVRFTLFYSTLLTLTDRRKNRQRNEYTRFAWAGAGGTFFPVVSFWFWREIGFGCTYYYVLGVPYSCGVVLVFLVLAGNSFWCYVRT